MSNTAEKLIVLTGGPGAGKTSLVNALQKRGYASSDEAGRGVIQYQMLIDGPALPWKDPPAFAEQMLGWEMHSYQHAAYFDEIVFFDRGIPDVIGYLQLLGIKIPIHVEKAAATFRYNRKVFITPPWAEIYMQDNERMQTFSESVLTYESMVSIYTQYGYELIELPKFSIDDRVAFILSNIFDN